MGFYITKEQLERRVTAEKLDALMASAGADKNTALNEITARAEALVDAHAAARYSLPLAPSALVGEWALSICELELHKLGSGARIPEKISASYQETMRQLKSLSEGVISLPGNPPAPASSGAGASAVFKSSEPVFDKRSLRRY